MVALTFSELTREMPVNSCVGRTPLVAKIPAGTTKPPVPLDTETGIGSGLCATMKVADGPAARTSVLPVSESVDACACGAAPVITSATRTRTHRPLDVAVPFLFRYWAIVQPPSRFDPHVCKLQATAMPAAPSPRIQLRVGSTWKSVGSERILDEAPKTGREPERKGSPGRAKTFPTEPGRTAFSNPRAARCAPREHVRSEVGSLRLRRPIGGRCGRPDLAAQREFAPIADAARGESNPEPRD